MADAADRASDIEERLQTAARSKTNLTFPQRLRVYERLQEVIVVHGGEPPTCSYREDHSDESVAREFSSQFSVTTNNVISTRRDCFGELRRGSPQSEVHVLDPRVDRLQADVVALRIVLSRLCAAFDPRVDRLQADVVALRIVLSRLCAALGHECSELLERS